MVSIDVDLIYIVREGLSINCMAYFAVVIVIV